ncbi:hypothetical protein [Streptomyces phaeochromogenes]|uniref:hypothetical protein n=1 Tax=Streptomyces phaeochromogenes TaxID=1923 RepID=UPI000AF7D716|nr:hypothetical protein [Streptomyces phaeochromogenes]
MPAITVDDVLVLPRLPGLDPAGTVHRLTTAQHGFEDYRAGRLGVIPAPHLPHTS